MRKRTWIILMVVLALIIAGAGYVYVFVYNKKHKNIEASRPDITTTSAELIGDFISDADSAQRKYSGKVVQFSGNVSSVTPGDSISTVIFDDQRNFTVAVEFLPKYNEVAKKLTAGQGINVKADYMGTDFDPVLAEMGSRFEIKLKKGSIVQEK